MADKQKIKRKAKEAKLSRSRAMEMLSYDPVSGGFTWRCSPSHNAPVGSCAGCLSPTGYRIIRFKDVGGVHAHRLAWLIFHGAWPEDQIDHINGIKDDNRIANLRDVSPAKNQQNRRDALPNNRLGVLGVSPRKGKYRARITVQGRVLELGKFGTLEQARDAYLAAKARYHPTSPIAEGR